MEASGAEEEDEESADACMRAMPCGVGTVATGYCFGDDHRGDQVEFHAAVLFGGGDGYQAQFGGFAQDGYGCFVVALADLVEVGLYIALPECVG